MPEPLVLHGVDLATVDGSGLYEVSTSDGVPVRLHDMALEELAYRPAAASLVLRLRYDPAWTPPAAEATPVAEWRFEGVHLLRWEAEEVGPRDGAFHSEVKGLDLDGDVVALDTFELQVVLRAREAWLQVLPA